MHPQLIKQNKRTSEVQNIDKGKNNACCSKVFLVLASCDAVVDCSTSSPFSFIFFLHIPFPPLSSHHIPHFSPIVRTE